MARETRRQLLDRLSKLGPLELRFIENSENGRVHIVVPREPQLLLKPVIEMAACICGYRPREERLLVGRGDAFVTAFRRADLCGPCHRLMGSFADQALVHAIPEEVSA